jgi:sRNA-binding regulator protein Hfq
MNRRLIRPSLSDIKEKIKSGEVPAPKPSPVPVHHEPRGGHPQGGHPQGGPHPQKKMHPPTDTSAESYYYLKQMGKRTPIAVVFADGEVIEGYIEWYDRACIKLNRDGAPNLLVYKNTIKYIYKLGEGKEGGEGEPDERR